MSDQPGGADDDPYLIAFDPREYLRQYYSRPQLAADDADLMRTLTGWLREGGRTYPEAVDVGCGPTIHNSFAFSPYAERIDLADYLPGNLAEIRKWLDRDPDAHDWEPLFRGVLNEAGGNLDTLTALTEQYRSRVRRLLDCDLRRDDPLGEPAGYDLVTSFFCAECVATSKTEWSRVMARLLGLVRPGGSVFLATVRDCTRYAVLGRWIPVTPVAEADLTAILRSHGFDPATIRVDAFPAPDWDEVGFDAICVARAHRR
jgi:hypothetical protein